MVADLSTLASAPDSAACGGFLGLGFSLSQDLCNPRAWCYTLIASGRSFNAGFTTANTCRNYRISCNKAHRSSCPVSNVANPPSSVSHISNLLSFSFSSSCPLSFLSLSSVSSPMMTLASSFLTAWEIYGGGPLPMNPQK